MACATDLAVRRVYFVIYRKNCDFSNRSFFFSDTAATEIYTLSLHDALPISAGGAVASAGGGEVAVARDVGAAVGAQGDSRADRKSTRLNSSHLGISYAVFCLKKKKTVKIMTYENGQHYYGKHAIAFD